MIKKALNSKALNNPIFAPYKKVLKYAKYIINANSIEQDGKEKNYGFIINVAILFEMYVTKLLQKEFSDWSINSPNIELYESNFFTRKIIPDIVMQKDNKILVFDTKYKKMTFKSRYQNGGDLDRNDFFQINTYMSYYNNQNEYNLVAGGLLYPMEETYNEEKCFSNSWLGDTDIQFIVDGIELNNINEDSNISEFENRFVNRIKNLVNQT